jgi:hypothetical protein
MNGGIMSDATRRSDTPRELFDEVAAAYVVRPGVSLGRIFHSDGLKVNAETFALLVGGRLVVKLPASRAVELA